VRLALPSDVSFSGTPGNTITLQGNEVVITIGHLASGSQQTVSIPVEVSRDARGLILGFAGVTSSTALPLPTNPTATIVTR